MVADREADVGAEEVERAPFIAGADIEQLMRCFEETPDTYVRMSVSEMNVRVKDRNIRVAMPDASQRALLDGHWDATGLLTDKFDEVRAVADGLPYVNGFSREVFRRIE